MNKPSQSTLGKHLSRIKVLVVGDSISLGAAEVIDDKVTRRVDRCYVEDLRAEFPHAEFVVDAGVNRTTDAVCRIIDDLQIDHHPNIVLLLVGGPDADLQWRRFIVSNGRVAQSAVPPERYEKNLRNIIEQVLSSGAQPIISDVPNHYLAARAPYVSRLCGRDVRDMLERGGGQPASDLQLDKYRQIARQIADETGTAIVEYARLLSTYPPDKVIGFDGTHPTDLAHRLIAEAIVPVIADALSHSVAISARQPLRTRMVTNG